MNAFRHIANPYLTDPLAPDVIRFPLVTRENVVMTSKLHNPLPMRVVSEALMQMGAKFNQQRVLIQTNLGTANIYVNSIVITGAHSEDGGRLLLNQILRALLRFDPEAFQPPEVRYASVVHPWANIRNNLPLPLSRESSPSPHAQSNTTNGPSGAASSLGTNNIPEAPINRFLSSVCLQNMVGCVRTGHHLEDMNIMKAEVVPTANYEPHVFPGLMVRIVLQRPTGELAPVSVTFHASGSAIITGATKDWDLWNAACWACAQIWTTYRLSEKRHSEQTRLRVLCSNGFVDLTTQLKDSHEQEAREMLKGIGAASSPVRPLSAQVPQLRASDAILQHYGSAIVQSNSSKTSTPARRAGSQITATSGGNTTLVPPATGVDPVGARTHIQTVLSDTDLGVVSDTVARINSSLSRLRLTTSSPAHSSSSSRSTSPHSNSGAGSSSNSGSAIRRTHAHQSTVGRGGGPAASSSAPMMMSMRPPATATTNAMPTTTSMMMMMSNNNITPSSSADTSPHSSSSTPSSKRSVGDLESMFISPSKRASPVPTRTTSPALPPITSLAATTMEPKSMSNHY